MAFAAANDEYLPHNGATTTNTISTQTSTTYIDYGDDMLGGGDDDESQMNGDNSFFCFHCMKNHFNYDIFLWSVVIIIILVNVLVLKSNDNYIMVKCHDV